MCLVPTCLDMEKGESRIISRNCRLIMIIFEGGEAGIYLGGEISAILDILSLSGDRYLVAFGCETYKLEIEIRES